RCVDVEAGLVGRVVGPRQVDLGAADGGGRQVAGGGRRGRRGRGRRVRRGRLAGRVIGGQPEPVVGPRRGPRPAGGRSVGAGRGRRPAVGRGAGAGRGDLREGGAVGGLVDLEAGFVVGVVGPRQVDLRAADRRGRQAARRGRRGGGLDFVGPDVHRAVGDAGE